MPVIRVQALRTRGVDVADLLKDVSAAVAKAFSIESAQCWSCFTEILPGEMFEGGSLRGGEQSGHHSPLVTISAYQGRSRAEIAAALEGVAEAVVSRFGYRKGDVFVEYRELTEGTVHTGGKVR